MHARTHACTHARTHEPTNPRTHPRTHPCTHPPTHVRMRARTHAPKHPCTCPQDLRMPDGDISIARNRHLAGDANTSDVIARQQKRMQTSADPEMTHSPRS